MPVETNQPMPLAPGFANAGGTVPTPAPDGKTQPTGQWSSEVNPLQWEAGTAPVILTAEWGSPLFDLRPELRAADGKEHQAIPVWRTGNGAGGHLMVFIQGLASTTSHKTLRVRSREWGHPTDSRRVQQVGPFAELTASVAGNNTPAAVLTFYPTGSGYPMRFWRVKLTFNLYLDVLPPLAVTAGFY